LPPFRLEIEGSGKTWRQDQKVRLRHVDTQGYLHSHDKKYTRIAGGQQEVSFYYYFVVFLSVRIFLTLVVIGISKVVSCLPP
jgi:hypothetical protein